MTKKHIGAKAPFALPVLLALAAVPFASALDGAAGKEMESFDTGRGEFRITFLGHASLVFEFGGAVIYIDPVRQYADFSKLPKADLILVTHEHGDHLDAAARTIQPKILYPYHFGSTDTGLLTKLLADEKGIEIRVRKLQ